MRCQRQLAAGDKIELSRFAPDFQHHDTQRIAGQRVGRRLQCGVHIRRAHGHEDARIETKFGQSTHRQRTRFNLGEILTHPDHGPPGCRPPRKARDKPGRRGTLPAGLSEHLVHRPQGEAALQRRIRVGMAERHPVRQVRIAVRLDVLDAATQSRKRARACAGHAPLLQKCWPFTGSIEPVAGSIVHDMF